MSIKSTYQTIKDFLFSNLNKQFFIFLFFLLLSGIFWLMMTLNETYERELKIPVQIVNVPQNVVLTSTPTDTVKATVKDKGWMLMSYLFGQKISTLKLSFKNYDRGNGAGIVAATDLKRYVEALLETSSKVTAIKPEKLEFFYNNGEMKRVPVRWTGRVIPEQLYFISQVDYHPDSVSVYASHEKLDSIHYIYTEPLNYAGFRDTLLVSCKLSHPNDVKVVPERIKIGFMTDVLTEEVMEGVPVKSINVPEGKVLRTFPAKVRVHFVAGASQIRHLHPDDFVVIADYNEVMQKTSDKCNIYLRTVPQGISRATLEAKQVDYLIEEE